MKQQNLTVENLTGAISRRWRIGLLALAALIAIVAVILHRDQSRRAIESIAVLPFVNTDGDAETESLAHGMTEALINDLSRLSDLKVRPRNSVFRYTKPDVDPRVAGRELDVEAVLTGQAAVRGGEITLSLQLTDARENRQLWGARHERRLGALLTLQADIAREVSESLRPRGQQPLAKRHTNSDDAYRAYFRGRYFWDRRNQEGFDKAIESFNQAIAIDPNYALAYSGLADCHLSRAAYGLSPPGEGFSKAKAAARAALAIDDALAEAHTTLANIAWVHEWEWAEAERGFKQALHLNPNYPTAHQWYAVYLSASGRHEEAIAEIRRAQSLDPLSPIIESDAIRVLYFARRYDQAMAQALKAREMNQDFHHLNNWLRLSYEQSGLHDQAFEETLKVHGGRGAKPETMAAFKATYAASGWKGYWRKQREMVEKTAGKKPVSPHFIAGIYARLGENDKALDWLRQAYDQRSEHLVTLKVDPVFDRLRSDRRFVDLQRRIGLAP